LARKSLRLTIPQVGLADLSHCVLNLLSFERLNRMIEVGCEWVGPATTMKLAKGNEEWLLLPSCIIECTRCFISHFNFRHFQAYLFLIDSLELAHVAHLVVLLFRSVGRDGELDNILAILQSTVDGARVFPVILATVHACNSSAVRSRDGCVERTGEPLVGNHYIKELNVCEVTDLARSLDLALELRADVVVQQVVVEVAHNLGHNVAGPRGLSAAVDVYLPSVSVENVLRDEMYSGHGSDLCSIHLSQVSVVASTKHLGAALDATICHEFVEHLSSLLMEFASSAVTLDGHLNTSKTMSVWKLFPTGFVTHISNEMSLGERLASDCSSSNAAGVTEKLTIAFVIHGWGHRFDAWCSSSKTPQQIYKACMRPWEGSRRRSSTQPVNSKLRVDVWMRSNGTCLLHDFVSLRMFCMLWCLKIVCGLSIRAGLNSLLTSVASGFHGELGVCWTMQQNTGKDKEVEKRRELERCVEQRSEARGTAVKTHSGKHSTCRHSAVLLRENQNKQLVCGHWCAALYYAQNLAAAARKLQLR
ncbi:hypothetical protein KCU83_g317, partial [Aureobasidium melanogenum]